MRPLTLEILMEQGWLGRALMGAGSLANRIGSARKGLATRIGNARKSFSDLGKQPPTNSWWRKKSGPRQLQFNFDPPAKPAKPAKPTNSNQAAARPRQLEFDFNRAAAKPGSQDPKAKTAARVPSAASTGSQDYRAQTPGRIPSNVQSKPVVSKPSTPKTPNLKSRMARAKARTSMARMPTSTRKGNPNDTRKGNPDDFGYGVPGLD